MQKQFPTGPADCGSPLQGPSGPPPSSALLSGALTGRQTSALRSRGPHPPCLLPPPSPPRRSPTATLPRALRWSPHLQPFCWLVSTVHRLLSNTDPHRCAWDSRLRLPARLPRAEAGLPAALVPSAPPAARPSGCGRLSSGLPQQHPTLPAIRSQNAAEPGLRGPWYRVLCLSDSFVFSVKHESLKAQPQARPLPHLVCYSSASAGTDRCKPSA